MVIVVVVVIVVFVVMVVVAVLVRVVNERVNRPLRDKMASSVRAKKGHSSGRGGRVVGGGEQAHEGSNGHLSGSQGGSQQWMGWASSWG